MFIFNKFLFDKMVIAQISFIYAITILQYNNLFFKLQYNNLFFNINYV
jgi:hypothetical protein